MLGPQEDWREWSWTALSGVTGVAGTTTMRVWRITVRTGGVAGTLAFGAGVILDIPANTTLTIEPFGMLVGVLTFANTTYFLIEQIQKN